MKAMSICRIFQNDLPSSVFFEILANLLLVRWERACKTAQVAKETLARLCPNASGDGYSTIQKLISEESKSYECSPSLPSKWENFSLVL